MTDETGDSGKIKVVDKRMFTADGELREDFRHLGEAGGEGRERPAAARDRAAETPERTAGAPPSPPVVEPGSKPPRAAAQGSPAPDLGPRGSLGKPGFMDLIGVLAEPIAIYLGDARLPDGSSAENLEAARFHIDLLEVVQAKTQGNLTPQESNLLEDLLYQLRMRYVRKRG